MNRLPKHTCKLRKIDWRPTLERQIKEPYPNRHPYHVRSGEIKELWHNFQNQGPAKNKIKAATKHFKHVYFRRE
jgi:hypothetical protein